MRSVTASAVIPKNINALWGVVSRPEGLQTLSEAFAGWGTRMHYVVENGTALELGAQVAVNSPRGRTLMRWRVSTWEPPTDLALLATEDRRFFAPFHMLMTLKLLGTDEDRTEVTVSFVLIFFNKTLEMVSLLLPVQFLYGRRLKRTLNLCSRSLA